MIAVALSGGLDSAAAAILLKAAGAEICGVLLRLGPDNPDDVHLERARMLCRHLDVDLHVIDAQGRFAPVEDYFCREYLAGRTPNPCAVCNRDVKFDYLINAAEGLGADRIATGHYVRKGFADGRCFLRRGRWRQSQEYFMALVGQLALARSEFPLGDLLRPEVERVVADAGLVFPLNQASQDVCFVSGGDYAAFIERHHGFCPVPGDVIDVDGRVIGRHRGAIYYTIGQRKGLGMGFGRRVYVLDVNMEANTVIVGERSQWQPREFYIRQPNYMKIAALDAALAAECKVRYRQDLQPVTVFPCDDGAVRVKTDEIFAPGQLAVIYDRDGAILLAGMIDR